VFVVVAPGTPMAPTGFRIIVLIPTATGQASPTSLPAAKKVKE
jgi:hypothetical protein